MEKNDKCRLSDALKTITESVILLIYRHLFNPFTLSCKTNSPYISSDIILEDVEFNQTVSTIISFFVFGLPF